jgi:hypothetical protein
MAAISLLEAAKAALNGGETKRAGIIATFARSSAWLANLVFRSIPGNAYSYNQESVLPGIAFRGVNEGYTASAGVINPAAEALRIAGGDLTVDPALVRMFGTEVRTTQEMMKTKALSATLSTKLIKGDSSTDPREFDGLQARINTAGTQFVSAGTTDAGDALSLFKLDQLLGLVAGPNKQLWLNKTLIQRLTQAARTYTVGGFIMWTPDAFGRQIPTYNSVPLVEPYPENDGTEPVAFDEQGDLGSGGSPGGTSATSIYCVSIGDGLLRRHPERHDGCARSGRRHRDADPHDARRVARLDRRRAPARRRAVRRDLERRGRGVSHEPHLFSSCIQGHWR